MPMYMLDWLEAGLPCLEESQQVWERLAEEENIRESANGVVVPFARFICSAESCLGSGRPVAVEISGSDDPMRLHPFLGELEQIHIDFSPFNDGRGFSSAQLLRRRSGYRGRLVALGEVLRDQIAFMVRCGIDGFDLDAPFDLAILEEIPFIYQQDALCGQTVLQKRGMQVEYRS